MTASDPLPPDDPVAIAQALIRCPSVTPAEAGCLDLLESLLQPAGFICRRMPFAAPDTEPVDNLFAQIGSGRPHLCFAGHTDVVPVGDAAAWRHEPFGAVLEDGDLHGRGASDMKGAVAGFVSAVLGYLDAHGPPPGAISLLLTGDEEGPAINGTKPVIETLNREGAVIDACIVGEPTNPTAMGEMIKIGRRGSLNGWLTVTGVQGHAAYPAQADNPLPKLVDLLATLKAITFDSGSAAFQPSNLELTTIDTGNSASNVIPARATARFNVRFNDLHSGASIESTIRDALEATGIGHDLVVRISGESFLTVPGPLSELVATAVAAETGRHPELSTAGGTSDARFIAPYAPVVECGAVNATIHQVDEHAAIADIHALTAIYRRIIEGFFATPERFMRAG